MISHSTSQAPADAPSLHVPMRMEFGEDLLRALTAALIEAGAVAVPAERSRPFSVPQAAEEMGVHHCTVRTMVEAGTLARCPFPGRVLIPVVAVREFQNGRPCDAAAMKALGVGGFEGKRRQRA